MITKIETLAANLDAKKLFLTTMATKKWSKPGVQKTTLNLRIMCKDVNEENGLDFASISYDVLQCHFLDCRSLF